MAEIDSCSKYVRASSVSSATSAMHESSSVPTSPRSSSPIAGWPIQYKKVRESGSKGVWDGYQTKEEFMIMHLR